MSQASDLIAEVKAAAARVERGIRNFEKDVEEVGHWTDLAQLQIAASRLKIFEDTLRDRKIDLEEATVPVPEATPVEPITPEPVVEPAATEPAV